MLSIRENMGCEHCEHAQLRLPTSIPAAGISKGSGGMEDKATYQLSSNGLFVGVTSANRLSRSEPNRHKGMASGNFAAWIHDTLAFIPNETYSHMVMITSGFLV